MYKVTREHVFFIRLNTMGSSALHGLAARQIADIVLIRMMKNNFLHYA